LSENESQGGSRRIRRAEGCDLDAKGRKRHQDDGSTGTPHEPAGDTDGSYDQRNHDAFPTLSVPDRSKRRIELVPVVLPIVPKELLPHSPQSATITKHQYPLN
jgi:hypothetical protein